jgi:transcriptional antiterminator NusG
MKNWVILFVRTGTEEKIVRLLKRKLSAEEHLPFLPVKEVGRRSKGVICKERKLLFKGYVFIQTEVEPGSIAASLESALTNASGKWYDDIYKILHYGDNKKDVAVREKERLCWEHMFDSDFCIIGSVGFIEGDTVRIKSGPLVSMESRIKKIDRHKREAVVEMEMMGTVREVRVMLEVIEKTNKNC